MLRNVSDYKKKEFFWPRMSGEVECTQNRETNFLSFFFKTRLWEAVKCWDVALHLNPNCAALHEMKAQVGAFLGTSDT